MRVLHIIHGLSTGGAEIDLVAKSIHLKRYYGYDITFVCLLRRGELAERVEAEGISVCGPIMQHRRDMQGLRRLRTLLQSEPWDIVHSHLFAANFLTHLVLLTLFPTPFATVASEHAMAERWGRPAITIDRYLIQRFSPITVPSRAALHSYVQRGLQKKRLILLPNGIDLTRYDAVDHSNRNAIRAALAIPDDAFVVGTVCRLEPVKRLEQTLSILATLDVVWLLVGDGSEWLRLSQIIAEKQLQQRVRLLGERHDVPDLMTAFDASLLFSVSESFGLVIAESLLTGVPVVASRVGGIRDVTKDGKFATLLDPHDFEGLPHALDWVKSHPQEARKQARAGGAFVRATYGLESVTQQLDTFYRALQNR